jgi:hypothetical protein
MRKVEDMNTVDMADLRRRVEENVAALYAGEDLPHQFTEEESLALRPEEDYGSGGFGIHSDGRVAHCGNALMGMSELDIHLLSDGMRIAAGFTPQNTSEEFRASVRADIPRRLDLALRAEENQRARMHESKRDFEMRRALGRLYWLFRLRFVVMMAVFFLALWLLQR